MRVVARNLSLFHRATLYNIKEINSFRSACGIYMVGNCVFICLAFLFLWIYDPRLFFTSLMEDRLVQWLQFSSLFTSYIFANYFAYTFRKVNRFQSKYHVGIAVFFFVLAMEEISWGQRFFGIEKNFADPENKWPDLDLHNIFSIYLGPSIGDYFLGMLIFYICILPWLFQSSKLIKTLKEEYPIFIPPKIVIPGFCAACVAIFCGNFLEEIGELLLYITLGYLLIIYFFFQVCKHYRSPSEIAMGFAQKHISVMVLAVALTIVTDYKNNPLGTGMENLHNYYGWQYKNLEFLDEATKEFQIARKINPRSELALKELAKIHVLRKEYGKAEKLVEKLVFFNIDVQENKRWLRDLRRKNNGRG